METWSVTVSQLDNSGRKPAAYLPTLKISGVKDPVVQLFEEKTGELVYAYRLRGSTARPLVFALGNYTVKAGDPEANRWKTVTGVAAAVEQTNELAVTL
jgi:hypothetical protein